MDWNKNISITDMLIITTTATVVSLALDCVIICKEKLNQEDKKPKNEDEEQEKYHTVVTKFFK